MTLARETTEAVHWQRLLLGIGVVSAAYAVMLQPVLTRFASLDAAWNHEAAVKAEIRSLTKHNLALEAKVRHENAVLGGRSATVRRLAGELASLQKKEKALAASIQTTTVTATTLPSVGGVPQVSTVTGASGAP